MSDRFRIVAIISAYNEGDIISATIRHLVENGVDVYLLDDRSTDDTVDQARTWLGRGLLEIESFSAPAPDGAPAGDSFQWGRILQRKEELAGTLPADWFIHHDADEIRESPWPGVSLRDAIAWVDRLGYNAIDFRVLNFPPVDDGFRAGDDPRTYFSRYEEAEEFNRLQLKCWKKSAVPPSLLPFGGHEVQFAGRRIFPVRFLMRHYPIRGQSHGMRKVFAERKGRFLQSELSRGWHLQYDRFGDDAHCFLRDPATLIPFDLDRVRLEQMLPGMNLRNLAARVVRADEALDTLRGEIAELRRHALTLNADRDSLSAHAANLEGDLRSLREHATRLATERDELKRHAAAVKQELDSVTHHTAVLDKDRTALRQHAATLENDRDALRAHAATLEKERDSLRGHAATLENDRDALRAHAATLEKERDSLRQHATTVEQERDSLRRHAANVERDRESLAQHAANLEKDRHSLTAHAATLAKDLDSLSRHAAVLEKDRDSLTAHAANLASDRDSLRQHATNLERELELLRRHVDKLSEGK